MIDDVTEAGDHDPVTGDAANAWNPLRFFAIYRALLSGVFVMLVLWGVASRLFSGYDAALFGNTAYLYAAFSMACLFAAQLRRPSYDLQVPGQVFVDIVAITLFMHGSGGVTSGFGMLLIVAVAGGSILTEGAIAFLFAALASLAVLSQQIYVWLYSPFEVTNYPHAGILGATFFATAYLASVSARRIKQSEALAARREVDLANLAALNEHIIARMQSGILAIDDEGVIRLVNRSARRLLGTGDRTEGRPLRTLVPALHELLQTWLGDTNRSTYMLDPGGVQLSVMVSFAGIGRGASDGVLVFLEDASAMTQRAQQLKLASLGRLAASIAHEIRNPLGAVSHAAQLLAESPQLGMADTRLLHIIRENSARMNAIVENVLQLGRGKPAVPEHLRLAPWLGTFVQEFRAATGAKPESVSLSVEPEALEVRADPSQLHQVVWNLCENGLRHAGPEPRLELRAGIGGETHRPYLEVVDNGPGIPADVGELIFEPFYTTRTDGTGLGLYISRELCEGNQATLNLVPIDEGCRFRITFADPRRQGVVPA